MSGESYKYLQRWNFKTLKPVMNEPFFAADEARSRYHSRRDWFTVVPDQPKLGETTEPTDHGQVVPEFVIEVAVSNPDFTVYFCNPAGAIRRLIGYKNIDSRLFKSEIIDYTYPDELNKYTRSNCTTMLTGYFKPHGYASLEINDKRSRRSGSRSTGMCR